MSDYESTYKRKRSRKPISLDDLKLRATDAFKAVEKLILDDDVDPNQRINAVNALSGLISRYAKLTEVHDLENRIKELEDKTTRGKQHEKNRQNFQN